MKKYHHRPTLGVKSGRRRLVVSKMTKKAFAQRGELHYREGRRERGKGGYMTP